MTATKSLTKVVDDLGRVKAQIAELQSQEGLLRQALIDAGMDAIDGKLFRAAVVHSSVCRVDYKSAVAELPQTPALLKLLAKHTTTQEQTSVRVYSR